MRFFHPICLHRLPRPNPSIYHDWTLLRASPQTTSLSLFYCHRHDSGLYGCPATRRPFSTSRSVLEKPSSKLEETVQLIKDKKNVDKADSLALPSQDRSVTTPVKTKSLWIRFVDECKHYYSGFKLLFLDVTISTKIGMKILRGQTLTRREHMQLVRTTSDLFRLVPFSVFIIVPFMELLLPVALKLFPGMLPSTFTTKSERENKMKRTLLAKLEYAKFLQQTLDEMPATDKVRSSQSAKDFVEFYHKIKSRGDPTSVCNEDILKFSQLFQDEITLDNMTRAQLVALCRLLELTPIGTTNFLRIQLEMRVRHLKADDKVIQKEGLDNMTMLELQQACKERGMRALGVSEANLKKQLNQWLDLSTNGKVPPSLLLLSRTLYLPDSLEPTAKIAATISALPEAAASATTAKIGELEGKIENKVRLQQLKVEQKKIEEEAAEKRLMKMEEKKSDAMKDTAPVLSDKATELKEPSELLDSSDLSQLKSAVDSLGKGGVESKQIKSLKKELKEYEEDVKDLASLAATDNMLRIKESKGAQRLFVVVNKILDRVSRLEHQDQKTLEPDVMRQDEEKDSHDEDFVTIQEIVEAVRMLQQTPDSSKLEQIAEVLSAIDEDADGVINIDHVHKVIEMLAKEHIQLPAKQIKKIVEMLSKEEMLDMEQNIETLLTQSASSQKSSSGL